MEKLEKLIREYLEQGSLMQVTTSRDDQPRVSNVWYSFDEKLNLYFISNKERLHSKEIGENKKVAVSIVVPELIEGLGQKCRGLTMQGEATELGIASSLRAFNNFMKRWPEAKKYIKLKDLKENLTATRFYKIKPNKYILFDEINYPEQPRQELIMK